MPRIAPYDVLRRPDRPDGPVVEPPRVAVVRDVGRIVFDPDREAGGRPRRRPPPQPRQNLPCNARARSDTGPSRLREAPAIRARRHGADAAIDLRVGLRLPRRQRHVVVGGPGLVNRPAETAAAKRRRHHRAGREGPAPRDAVHAHGARDETGGPHETRARVADTDVAAAGIVDVLPLEPPGPVRRPARRRVLGQEPPHGIGLAGAHPAHDHAVEVARGAHRSRALCALANSVSVAPRTPVDARCSNTRARRSKRPSTASEVGL